eukprot:g1612.t1
MHVHQQQNEAATATRPATATKKEAEANRKRDLMLKFRDSLRGPVLEKLYAQQIVGPSTSYDVEKWVHTKSFSIVKRIFQMDPLGALRQLRDLGAVSTGSGHAAMHVDAHRQQEGTRKRNTAKLKAAPFNAAERKSIDKHVALRVRKLLDQVNTDFEHEQKYLKKLKREAKIAQSSSDEEEGPGGPSGFGARGGLGGNMGMMSPSSSAGGASPGGASPGGEGSRSSAQHRTEVLRNIDVVELRLANLKRQMLKKKLDEEILLFIQEAEQLVYDERFVAEQKRAEAADAMWGSFFSTLKGAPQKIKDQQEAAAADDGPGFRRNVFLKKNNVQPLPVQTMSTVFDYIHARNVLEGSKSSLRREASTLDLSQPRKQAAAALSSPKDDVAQHRGTLKSRALERDRRKAAAQAARTREREELLQKKRDIEMLLRETGGGEEQGNANPSEGLAVLSPSRDPLSRGNPFPLRKGIVPDATGEGPGTYAAVESNYAKDSPAAQGGVSSASTSGIWRPSSPSVKLGTAGQGQLHGGTAKDPRQISANPQVAAELERLARVQALILKRMHSEWDKEFELEKSVAPHFYVPARGDEARKNFDVKHNRPRSSDLLRGRASAARAVKIENFPHTLRRTSSSQAPTTEGSERSKRATDKFINRQRSPKRYKKPDPLARPWNTRAESSKLNEKEVQEVAQLRRRSELGAERLLRKVVRPRLLEHADQQLAEHVLEEEEERLYSSS